ncbi:MAG TPA: EAL domain-containing protein [Gaiellaceae bacterium]
MKTARRRIGGAREIAWPLAAAAVVALAVAAGVVLGQQGDRRTAIQLGAVLAVGAAIGMFRLFSHLRRAEIAALSDALTGLPNRVLLADRVEQALRRSRRSGEPFSLVIVDLDGFKNVNDHRGHAAGDAVLRTLAQRFGETVRTSDTVARVGGDEFVVLSLGSRDEHEVAALVGRLRQALRDPIDAGGSEVTVDASIGWAIYPADGDSTDELLMRADEQMLATKRDTVVAAKGRGRRPSMAVLRSLEQDLHQGRLVVHYQPVIDLRSGAARRAHALVRGCTTSRGLLTPVELVGTVERTPLAAALALNTVADALRRAQAWREAGCPLGVSVGVPLRALHDDTFVDGVARLLNQTRAPEDVLTIELGAGDPAAAGPDGDSVGSIARLGVRIALADVVRSSSVAALRSVPLDELKIDATFVRGLVSSPTDATIVRALVEAGRELGFALSAEGVESSDALAELVRIGCDLAQGSFISPALPPDELLDWVAGRAAAEAV